MEIGNRLKKLRAQKNLTVAEVARRISVSASTYTCEFWPGTKNQCANSNCPIKGFTPLLQKQARPGLNPYIETLSGKRVCLIFVIQIRSDDNFREIL